MYEAAIELADESGIESLTMRKLAARLDVEAMSLYHHVANKDALLTGVLDTIVAEIEEELGDVTQPVTPDSWRSILRNRILTARRVMLSHPWATGLIETRSTSTPSILRYMNALLGILLDGGFSYDLGHHTLHALGSRALGFNQELFQPAPGATDGDTSDMVGDMAAELPNLVGMLSEVVHADGPEATLGWCDDQTEFEFGLDVLLDGLEKRVAT